MFVAGHSKTSACLIMHTNFTLELEKTKMQTHKIPSRSSKKYRSMWPVMIDDSASTQKKRKLVKTYESMLPQM